MSCVSSPVVSFAASGKTSVGSSTEKLYLLTNTFVSFCAPASLGGALGETDSKGGDDFSSFLLLYSHTLAVASAPPVAMRLPSGEKATELTLEECPLSVSSSSPRCASHTLAVASVLPVAMRVPSGEKATELTL